jgi:hypothetical protein
MVVSLAGAAALAKAVAASRAAAMTVRFIINPLKVMWLCAND